MLMSAALTAVFVFSVVVTAYFVLWNTSQIVMGVCASLLLWRHERRYGQRSRALVEHLASPPLVSSLSPPSTRS